MGSRQRDVEVLWGKRPFACSFHPLPVCYALNTRPFFSHWLGELPRPSAV